MSGGSYDYMFYKIFDMAEDIRPDGACQAAPKYLRLAFKEHLRKIARACKAIEWNDSYDGDDDEEELIEACFHPTTVGEVLLPTLKTALLDIQRAMQTDAMQDLLAEQAVEIRCDMCGCLADRAMDEFWTRRGAGVAKGELTETIYIDGEDLSKHHDLCPECAEWLGKNLYKLNELRKTEGTDEN